MINKLNNLNSYHNSLLEIIELSTRISIFGRKSSYFTSFNAWWYKLLLKLNTYRMDSSKVRAIDIRRWVKTTACNKLHKDFILGFTRFTRLTTFLNLVNPNIRSLCNLLHACVLTHLLIKLNTPDKIQICCVVNYVWSRALVSKCPRQTYSASLEVTGQYKYIYKYKLLHILILEA